MMKKFLFLLLLGQVAAAQDNPGVDKYRNHTPEQIAEMPQDVRSSEVPMMYNFAAQNGVSEGSDLLFAMHLNMIMYPGVSDYDSALRQFQEDMGDEPNGVLTVWQIHNLEQRADMQKLSSIIFPNQFYSYIDEEYANVTGTWIILDDDIAYPINHAEVKCWRGEGYCEMDQLLLNTPDEDSWSQSYSINQFDTEYYNISSWTEDTIDAVPQNRGNQCRTVTLNFNFSTKEFYEITRNAGKECEVLGQVMPPLDKPRISQIVDGEDIIAQEFAELKKAAFDVLAADFRVKIEKLIAEQQKSDSN